jgi:DnaK suppressor protein
MKAGILRRIGHPAANMDQSMSAHSPQASEVRARLQARRAELSTRQRRVDDDLARRNEPLVADSADQAIQLENDQALTAIREAAAEEICAIGEAIERLDVGLYGVCKRCGDQIAPARLQAVPQAVVCTACSSD